MTHDPHIQSGRDTIQAGRDVIQVGGDYVVGDKIAGNKIVNNYYGTPPPVETTPEQRASSLAAYRQRLLEDTHYISLAGIPLPRDQAGVPLHLQMPLEQVYIRIQAIEHQQARQERERERDEMARDSDRRDVFSTLQMMGEYFYRQGQVYAAEKRPEPIDPQEALRQHHRLVILGAPGSGKSTLLRMLTRTAAQQPDGPVPILVRLRDYATYRATGSGSLRDFALDQAAQGDAALRAALEQAPQILWLVDALDEARSWQGTVVEQVRQLQGNLVLTSRPVGYPGGLESLTHFEVLPLIPDDVDRFLHDWFGVLAAQRKAPDGWVEERVAWLKKQLDERPRIQALTRNPLLLTFLVVLAGDDPVRDLPTQRAELYRRYVEELLDSWEAQRRPVSGADGQSALKLGRLVGEDARQAALRGLYRTGWYLHLTYNDAMPGYEPTAMGIIAYLVPFLQTEWDCAAGEAQSIAQAILSFWSEAGLLDIWRVENAEYLAFRHLTFQEYAAAWALREAYQQNAKQAWRFVRPRLHHYAWREPLLLLSTMLEQKHVDTLVRRLVRGTSRYEHDLLRDLRLAIAMVGENASLPQKTVNRLLERVRRLLHARMFPRWLTKIAVVARLPVKKNAWVTAKSIETLGVCDRRALSVLQYALRNACLNVREAAAKALGKIGDPAVCCDLLRTLEEDPDWQVRNAASEALGQIADPDIIPNLLCILQSPDSLLTRSVVVQTLGLIGETAVPFLKEAIQRTDGYAQSAAIAALGDIGKAAVPTLQQALYNAHPYVQQQAATALIDAGEAGILALQEALHSHNENARRLAASALSHSGNHDAMRLLENFVTDKDKIVRQFANAARMVNIPTVQTDQHNPRNALSIDPDAIPNYTCVLQFGNTNERRVAVELLGETKSEAAISPLSSSLQDESPTVRKAGAQALGQIGSPAAIPSLVSISHNKGEDEEVRVEVIQALGNINSSEVIPHLLPYLQDRNVLVRMYAVNTLYRLIFLSSDIKQIRKTLMALNGAVKSREVFETQEQAANRLSVLEVQANPGSDPLVSPAPVRQIAWGWKVLVGVVLVAAILAVLLLPLSFWQARVVVALATVLTILAGIAGLLGVSVRNLFRRKTCGEMSRGNFEAIYNQNT